MLPLIRILWSSQIFSLYALNGFGVLGESHVEGAPDLVVEILPPSTKDRHAGVKARIYAKFGVGEYWVVDPDQETVLQYTLTPEGFAIRGPFGPGDSIISTIAPHDVVVVSSLFPPK